MTLTEMSGTGRLPIHASELTDGTGKLFNYGLTAPGASGTAAGAGSTAGTGAGSTA